MRESIWARRWWGHSTLPGTPASRARTSTSEATSSRSENCRLLHEREGPEFHSGRVAQLPASFFLPRCGTLGAPSLRLRSGQALAFFAGAGSDAACTLFLV